MLSKQKSSGQTSFFMTLSDQLDSNHPLFKLSNTIDWKLFDDNFAKHYSFKMGKPSKPIRLMVSLLILKQLRNLSDENIVIAWSENLYYQYFSGQEYFIPKQPCSSTELVEFRKRIGVEGIESIFKESIRIDGKDSDDETLSADTTVQEKNITYPTDTKLHRKIIKKCIGISKKESILLHQSYKFVLKELDILIRFQRTKNVSKAEQESLERRSKQLLVD